VVFLAVLAVLAVQSCFFDRRLSAFIGG